MMLTALLLLAGLPCATCATDLSHKSTWETSIQLYTKVPKQTALQSACTLTILADLDLRMPRHVVVIKQDLKKERRTETGTAAALDM